MKINEVERLVGITKKNIRFYEGAGLLSPGRNKENGYREYGDEDIKRLEQIKLLRKLGMPLEEIRSMQSGKSTVADSMRRHLVTLEREQQNLAHSLEFCSQLKGEELPLSELDTHGLLAQMEKAEQTGASFRDIKTRDVKSKVYVGAVVASVVMVGFMSVLFFAMLWGFKANPEEAPPLPLMIVLLALPVIVIIGVVASLIQRIGEIKRGEMYDAKKF